MSLRIDTSEWISGSLIIGDVGGGIIGSLIPSGGESGAGYTYNDLSLPADANKEICGRITTWPSAGTLFAYEDTSFEFTGAPNGVYTFQYQLYVDYVAVGSPTTVTLTVGGTTHAATGALSASAAALAGIAARIGAPLNHAATGSMSASAASIAGTAAKKVTHTASGAISAASATLSGAAAIRLSHDAIGALVASNSTLSAMAAIRLIHESSGALVSSSAVISATASHSADSGLLRSAKKLFVKSSAQKVIVVRRKKSLTITTAKAG